MVLATDTLQRGGHRKLLALPKLSPDSPGTICLNRDVINQDGGSNPQARIRGAVRRQACWCTGSHSLWAVRLPDNVRKDRRQQHREVHSENTSCSCDSMIHIGCNIFVPCLLPTRPYHSEYDMSDGV